MRWVAPGACARILSLLGLEGAPSPPRGTAGWCGLKFSHAGTPSHLHTLCWSACPSAHTCRRGGGGRHGGRQQGARAAAPAPARVDACGGVGHGHERVQADGRWSVCGLHMHALGKKGGVCVCAPPRSSCRPLSPCGCRACVAGNTPVGTVKKGGHQCRSGAPSKLGVHTAGVGLEGLGSQRSSCRALLDSLL